MIQQTSYEKARQRIRKTPPDEREASQGPPHERELLETAERWIGDHPVICLGLALAMGVTLGWLIKRT